MTTATKYPLKVVTHPLRMELLGLFRALTPAAPGWLSPAQLARMVDEPLGNVSYHVRQLLAMGFIEPAGEQVRRGAVEHFYRVSPAGARVGRLVVELIEAIEEATS